MVKIAFVILHYNNLKDTKNCLESLQKYYLNNNNVEIIVVDNGSPKETIEVLEKEKIASNLHYIKSKKNLGFAKGNNLGFNFAKKQLKADIIILANNDTLFKQKDFIEKLLHHYKLGFDVAGPRILTQRYKKYYNSNPVPNVLNNPREVSKLLIKWKLFYLLSFFNLDKKLRKKFGKDVSKVKYIKGDYQLHGACLIFSKNYIEKFDGLYPGTFMYGEEDILKYRVKENNLTMKYFDDLIVYHIGGATTKKSNGVGAKNRRFKYKWSINSFTQLKNMMKKDI